MKTLVSLLLLIVPSLSAQNSPTAVQIEVVMTYTTLSVAMVAADATFTVADASQLTPYNPSTGSPIFMEVENETIRVCGIAGQVVTVCSTGAGRGAQGTKSPAHAIGAAVGVLVNQNATPALLTGYNYFLTTQLKSNGTQKYFDVSDLIAQHLRASLHGPIVKSAALSGKSVGATVTTAIAAPDKDSQIDTAVAGVIP